MSTMIEKIAGGSAGEFIRISPKHIMTHDNTSAVMGKFNAIGAAKIHNPKQPVFAIDHDIQNKSESNLGKYAKIEKFAAEQGVDFYPAGTGISHQVMIERGYVTPGRIVVGSDSHSNIYGALGALGTPVVRTDAASIWAIGETWWQVPKQARVWLRGKPQAGVVGKDVIIALCGLFNNDEVLNHAIEFAGDGVAYLSMEDRMTISNMTTEWGGLAGVFPFDETLRGWLTDRAEWLQVRRTPRYTPEDVQEWWENKYVTDDDAVFNIELELDLATVIPHVAGPDHVKVMRALPEIEQEQMKINKAYLLSCTNARIEDLVAASEVVDGKQIADGVDFYVAAASETIQEQAEQLGAWQKLEAAGATFLPPGCGTCIGLGAGTLEDGEIGISATNRNFKGRMGSRDAKAYLASPAVVAASAVNGYISSPTKYDDVEPSGKVISKAEPKTSAGSTEIIEGFPQQVTGRVLWLPMDNMNTDGIYSGEMTYKDDVTEQEMGDAAMCNYDPEFKDISKEGDIVVSGLNFGTGSSREQAATCLKVRGIPCVIAASFSETYKRNAINNGFLVIDCPSFVKHLRENLGANELTVVGGEITIDFTTATIKSGDSEFAFAPLGPVPQEVIVAGGAEAVVAEKLQA
jgi:homoaconitate hydratase